MTNPTQAGAPPANPPAFDYVGGTPELDQLLAIEADLYVKRKAIEEQLKDVQARIKGMLTVVMIAPGQPYQRYRIAIPGAVVRELKWTTSRRLNTPAFKADHPDLYAAYSQETGTWKLERAK